VKHAVKIEDLGTSESGNSPHPEDTSIMSLEFVLAKHGGYRFDFELLTGEKVPVSLDKFRGRDPKTTFLRIGVLSTPEAEGELERQDAKIRARHGDR
jgi:hypothetical protein